MVARTDLSSGPSSRRLLVWPTFKVG